MMAAITGDGAPLGSAAALARGEMVPSAGRPSGQTALAGMPESLAVDAFTVGPWGLATSAGVALEVLDPLAAYRLPRTRQWFAGVVNLHGAPVPLFDLALMLELRPPTLRKLMVFAVGAERAALLVDGLPRRIRLTADATAQRPALPPALDAAVTGAWQLDRLWLRLEPTLLFPALGRNARL